ncbi:MAG: hypothetical protein JRH01_22765 [Deltaproteobacteria bacterium]|nr:hypothetical protein [Deltaproteobacteria bacterium]MBW2399612.1 hypothetical protein [Deltaproteobacteria bacterium]
MRLSSLLASNVGVNLMFDLRIGDTLWDDSMPHDPPLVRFLGGEAIGILVPFTVTLPQHPDLMFQFPASPGTWEALDDDGVSNNGSITGTYELVAAAAAPALGFPGWIVAAALLLVTAAVVLAPRRSRGA